MKVLLVEDDPSMLATLERALSRRGLVVTGCNDGQQALDRWHASPPDVVLLCSYDLRSHGTPFFGANDASGRAIAAWVKANYVKVASGPPGPLSVTGHTWDLLALRAQVTP